MIEQLQREENQLRLLAAQRSLYNRAKVLYVGYAVLLAIMFVILFLYLVIDHAKEYDIVFKLIGGGLVLLDAFVITPWRQRWQKQAAVIQEEYDTIVLDLPWNDLKVGKRPMLHDVLRYGEKGADAEDATWYPWQLAGIPWLFQSTFCQEAICLWNHDQHKSTSNWLGIGIVLCAIAALVTAYVINPRFDTLLMTGIAVLPHTLFARRYIAEHRTSAERYRQLSEYATETSAMLFDTTKSDLVRQRRRNLQDLIFEMRQLPPLVPNFLYRWNREANQGLMIKRAEFFVKRVRQHLG